MFCRRRSVHACMTIGELGCGSELHCLVWLLVSSLATLLCPSSPMSSALARSFLFPLTPQYSGHNTAFLIREIASLVDLPPVCVREQCSLSVVIAGWQLGLYGTDTFHTPHYQCV